MTCKWAPRLPRSFTMAIDEQVQEWWASYGCRELTESGWTQVDLDDLLDPPPSKAAEVAVQCLIFAVRNARPAFPEVDGLLHVPLPYSNDEQVPLDHPTLAEVLRLEWDYGPGLVVPGIHLLRRSVTSTYESADEYRSKTLAGSDGLGDGLVAYYQARRTEVEEHRSGSLEWDRDIVIRTI